MKLHECFRLAEHPTLCEGKHIVRLKLLNPKNKKIDFCDDWPTFKQGVPANSKRPVGQVSRRRLGLILK